MNTADLKIKIFREVDALDAKKLKELYGVLLNFINSNTTEDWEKLSFTEKTGVNDAITEVNEGKGIYHTKVMDKYRKLYPND
jgi:hypothetical protein